MSKIYRNNLKILKFNKDKEDFKIEEGDWVMPTCCSLFVYII